MATYTLSHNGLWGNLAASVHRPLVNNWQLTLHSAACPYLNLQGKVVQMGHVCMVWCMDVSAIICTNYWLP